MNRSFSVYLDLVRFLAAGLVYMYHSNQRWLSTEVLPFAHYGHSAVIVFFVLSGFVIAWVTDNKERDWPTYCASRASRVFSVVVPALVLCVALDAAGRQFWAKPYGDYPFDQIPLRLVGSLLMLNEIWFLSITSLSNVPFWSITFEFWYYMLFALVMFLPKPWRRWMPVAVLVVLGPKIALLAPIWGAGVLLYRWRTLECIGSAWGWALLLVSSSLIVVFHAFGVIDQISRQVELLVGPRWFREFTFAKFFLSDYLLTILVFVNFVGMRRVAPQIAPLFALIARPVKWLASYTFTLYLLHQPLFLFWGAVWRGDPASSLSWWVVTAMTALSVVAIGRLTEQRRDALRRSILMGLRRVQARFPVSVESRHA